MRRGFRGYPVAQLMTQGKTGVGKRGTGAPRNPKEVQVDLSAGIVSQWDETKLKTILTWIFAQKGHETKTDVAMDDREATVAVETVRQAVEAGQAVSRSKQFFPTSGGRPFDGANLRREMKVILKKAMLPVHFTPHCLRCTYGSLMLQQGESIVYVQRQLGHASIQLTVDTYGKWLPMGNKGAVDRLDAEIGSRTVATGARTDTLSSILSIQSSDNPMYMLELAKGIEPSTCGLQISHGEVAQVFGDVGNLLSSYGECDDWAVGRACFSLSLGGGCLAA